MLTEMIGQAINKIKRTHLSYRSPCDDSKYVLSLPSVIENREERQYSLFCALAQEKGYT